MGDREGNGRLSLRLPIGRRAVGIICETISNSQEDPPQPKGGRGPTPTLPTKGGRKVRPAGEVRETRERPAKDPRKRRGVLWVYWSTKRVSVARVTAVYSQRRYSRCCMGCPPSKEVEDETVSGKSRKTRFHCPPCALWQVTA